jgi:glutaredoxin/glutathione-dependent peroxiredoxin
MIKVGDRLPEGTFRVKQDDDSVKEITTAELFKGQKVVFVGVPGAFTSTCHRAHIPTYITHASELKARGINRIVVMAVNDHHVMKMWGQSLGGEGKIDFVSDGDAIYANALGLAVKIPGMGTRVKRFSAVLDDGVVKVLNFEPEGGKGIQTTGAETILAQI